MSFVVWVAFALLVSIAAVFAAGRLGLFAGRAPEDLGVRSGRLKPPSFTPNSVSSQARLHPGHPQAAAAQIDPLPLRYGANGPATIDALAQIVESMPGAQIVARRPDYIYARYTTPWMGFVDDVEFWVDPIEGVVQVRSASRVGRGDWGVNRKRIEEVRRRLGKPGEKLSAGSAPRA